ncbi:bis(5'-nucleosyl)-tetraphosphatase [asymmetrical]-like isoform X2 [Hydractinia symbiolongicarpus]|uniref:bis(5'-nucleosyl)-tetraphosphatase [asymmetrical]-like isoform X2 n=1 Tax=Hydractinia symbiolongicarpus TaxID=13093 RepID=UPI00255124BB|nr:bis(5'-nucleosyl)-tetraphosphatase [asymmetrical]-like isoform X2 [Hydractinia symbiolongicarpus]
MAEKAASMVTKRAAGFVIYQNISGSFQYLLLQTSYGRNHWTPPKGHVDPGESDLQTAYRETLEESGITKDDLAIHENVKFELNYHVKGGIPKTSVYWLAKLINPEAVVKLSNEHIAFKWSGLKEACSLADFADFQDMLHKCEKYLCENN